MLTLSPAVLISVATGATDLRRSIDGLAALVREHLQLDPLSGHWFLFRNRRGDRVKVLAWDQSGFWVCDNGSSKGPSRGPLRTRARRSSCAARISSSCLPVWTWRRRAVVAGTSAWRERA